ncbi:uncharacterized protein TRIADDRAFT_61459 [Trichoplax adhaerens]|uniref:Death domain-containing protein n=1 Tax=Trichoplax adhaerens TaxID=10228 RepID=B3SB17_TRIAD|nr:predicted protein [Trichoplax adhaerens]EDV20031.1 predicted protein [Trichoplax adhaerens]|eukprot:XP_002117415.1 predicted protein [Trichoplax adhaerens]
MLSEAEESVLTSNYVNISKDLPYDSLIGEIKANKIIDDYESAELDTISHPIKRNKSLLDKLRKKPSGTFVLFCKLYSNVRSVQSQQGADLLRKIQDEKAKLARPGTDLNHITYENSNRQPAVDLDEPAKPYIKKIYRDIGVDWPKLALELDYSQNDIKRFKVDTQNDSNEQCAAMLYDYQRKHGSSFTKSKLEKALRESDLGEAADKLLKLSL